MANQNGQSEQQETATKLSREILGIILSDETTQEFRERFFNEEFKDVRGLLTEQSQKICDMAAAWWSDHNQRMNSKSFLERLRQSGETKIYKAQLDTEYDHCVYGDYRAEHYAAAKERLTHIRANKTLAELLLKTKDLDKNKQKQGERIAHSITEDHKSGKLNKPSLVSNYIDRLKDLLNEDGGKPKAQTICLANVEMKQTEWLWQDRIPLGNLSMIFGDGGCGKSQTTLYMASQVSQGKEWFDGSPCQGGQTLLVTGEDSLASTVAPRLTAAGADLQKTHAMGLVIDYDKSGNSKPRCFTLSDMPELKSMLSDMKDCRLVIIDPIAAFLDGRDSHKDSSIRELLTPLQKLAEDLNLAIVMVAHTNKSKGGKASAKVMGSAGFNNAVRSSFYAGKDADSDNYCLAHVKHNLAIQQPTLSYQIAGVELDGGIQTSKVDWLGEVETTADEMVEAAEQPTGKIDDAIDFLQGQFEERDSKYANDITDAARRLGISRATIYRAKDRLGLVATKPEFGGRAIWSLPEKE